MNFSEQLNLCDGEFDEKTKGRTTFRGRLGNRPIICRVFDDKKIEDAASNHYHQFKNICHPNILEYIGKTNDDNQISYFIFDSYYCSLAIALRGPQLIQSFSKATAMLELKLDDNNYRPSIHFQTIIREIIKGVKLLQAKGMSLRKLTSSNVAIGITESKELTAKLMGVIMAKCNGFEDYVNVAKIIRECSHAHAANLFVSKIEDMYTNASPVEYLNKVIINTTAKDMIRRTPEILFRHPFFWTSKEYVSFIYKASELYKADLEQDKTKHKFGKLINSFSSDDWQCKMPDKVKDIIQKGNIIGPYDTTYMDLLRFIRNNGVHYTDMPKDLQNEYGIHPDAFAAFFNDKYPGFIMHVYEAVEVTAYKFDGSSRADTFAEFYIL